MTGATLGLVTSIDNVKTCIDTRDVLEVEKVQARCTRLRKNLGVAAKLLCQGQARTCWMLTMTYAHADDWKPNHVRDCVRHLRQWSHRQGFKLKYLWVIEQKTRKSGADVGRKVPHYHLIAWIPGGIEPPHLDSMGWWTHGLTNAVQAVAPINYVMKYASKFDSEGSFPKGARCYGIGGLDPDQLRIRRWVNWPSFVQGNASYTCPWRRAVGGGWLDGSTGEVWASEWGLTASSRTCTRLVRLHRHPRRIEAAGPFSWLPQ